MTPFVGPPWFDTLEVYPTPADLPAQPYHEGWLEVGLQPPSLYIYTSSGGHQLVGSATPTTPATPASEGGQGVVELATEAEVQAGTAGVLVATVARLKDELDRRKAGVVSTETAQGIVELATTAEAQAGTLTGAYAMNPARVRESIQPEAWIAPTLLNSWVNVGAGFATAGYRKTPWGEVQCRRLLKDGTMTNGTVLFNLPVGYRPSASQYFTGLQGNNTACRLTVEAGGMCMSAVSQPTISSPWSL
jgi:hypothetical protein